MFWLVQRGLEVRLYGVDGPEVEIKFGSEADDSVKHINFTQVDYRKTGISVDLLVICRCSWASSVA